jgi:hypothetical protein
MALPSAPNSLSFNQIRNEFGENSTNSLGGYRISQTIGQMDNMPLSEGIAQGNSPIKFSQFRGNRLNIVLQYNTNFGTFSDPEVAPVAQSKWDNSGNAGFGIDDEVVVVGNLKDKPVNSKGKRIIIHVTSTIGGSKTNIKQNKCSLVTGRGWADDTELYINVGRTGLISGTGGFGGERGSEGSNGGDGGDGSSAIGINYTNRKTKIIVQNGGQVRAGGGGGGGGGGAENSVNGAPGGAGGAGAGIPDHESGRNNSTRETGLDGATGDKQIDAAGGGGGGGGAMPGGTPGEGGEAPTKPSNSEINPNNSQADDGQDGTFSGGGAGGKGDAEGEDQLEFSGGAGGQNGFAIARDSGVFRPDIVDPFGGIRGGESAPLPLSERVLQPG